MTVRHVARVGVLILLAGVVSVACGKKPPDTAKPEMKPLPAAGPPPAEDQAELVALTLIASADVNPNSTNRPSPVVVRVFQLKSDVKFAAADLLELYADEQKALGEDLNQKSVEVTLRPGETVAVPNFFVLPYTRHIGVIAAYRDYHNAQWKMVVPRGIPVKKSMTVSVGKLRVDLAAK